MFNITITFNPAKISLSETWSEDLIKEINFNMCKYFQSFYLVRESQKNMFCHFHGQAVLRLNDNSADLCYKMLNRRFGRSSVIKNTSFKDLQFYKNLTGIVDFNPDYKEYKDYALKDIEDNSKLIKDRAIIYMVIGNNRSWKVLKYPELI